MATSGGLTLGMNADEVRLLLGAPTQDADGNWLYRSERKVPMTLEQVRSFADHSGWGARQDFFILGRGVQVEFSSGMVTAIRVWQVTST
jgi:hypothetical protein